MHKIDLKGKKAFIAGIGDDQGFGWAIAKALAEAGAQIFIGTWPPVYKIFSMSLSNGKFDTSRKLNDGSLMQFEKVYPFDAVFDNPEDVPQEISENKRYKNVGAFTISEIANQIKEEYGPLDIVVHSLANAPEVQKPLLQTSRKGYLAAISASSYSFVSMLQSFAPIMNPNGSFLALTYLASLKVIPGYGGGMSSAKAALESDTRTLAFEAGRKWNIRINAISAGALSSRAARAIGFIDKMIDYNKANAPLIKDLKAEEVGNTALFLLSDLASAITGSTIYVDNGMHTMGVAVDSPCLQKD